MEEGQGERVMEQQVKADATEEVAHRYQGKCGAAWLCRASIDGTNRFAFKAVKRGVKASKNHSQ